MNRLLRISALRSFCLCSIFAAVGLITPAIAQQPAGEAPPEKPLDGPAAQVRPADVSAQQAAAVLLNQLGGKKDQAVSSGNLQFNFKGASWKTVLDWYAEQADLSMQIDRAPEGTVNFIDPTRTYSTSEAQDLMNRLLLDRGYALVRRGRMLFLVDLERENAAEYIAEIAELVDVSELDKRGRSDIVSCIFSLGGMSPDEAKEQLPLMKGPSGHVVVLASARQARVTDTAARLLAIRDVVQASAEEVVEIKLENRGADEMLELARPLIGLEPGENLGEEIKISVNVFGDRIYVTGVPSKVGLLQSMITKADQPLQVDDAAAGDVQLPTLKTYTLKSADSVAVFDVLQTLLQGTPDARVAIEPTSKSIIVYGRPDTHTEVAKILAEMEGNGEQLKVLTLRRLDPAQALLTINKYFGITDEGGGSGPKVDGDPVTGKLWIRGTESEIKEIETLITALEGEDELDALGGKIRVLPYSGSEAEDALEQIQTIWPATGRINKIRTISPSRNGGSGSSGMKERRINREVDREQEPEIPTNLDARSKSTSKPMYLIAENDKSPSENKSAPDPIKGLTGDDIVIQFSPAGMIIASDDIAALDVFENLMQRFAPPVSSASDLPTIFWLKYAKADVTAELIATILGGSESTLDSMTDSLTGGGGFGGMLGGLMGMGGGGGGGGEASNSKSILTTTGSVVITSDNRLNALFVQANAIDMATVEMVLEKVDRMESPEDVELISKPMLIPVIYQDAAKVAEVVQKVFSERIATAQSSGRGGGGNQQQQQAAEFIAAIRGGGGNRRGGGGGGGGVTSEPTKINIAVDEVSNSLIVTANKQDYEEVKLLVEALDEGGKTAKEEIITVPVPGGLNAEAMIAALEAMLGRQVETTSSEASGRANPAGTTAAPSSQEFQNRINALRAFGGGGGRGAAGAGGRPGGGGGFGAAGGGRGGGGGPGGGGRGGGGGPGGGGRGN